MKKSTLEVIEVLESAQRMNSTGAESDTPEGIIYIQISDTLAKLMVDKLKSEQ
jgi:hypothetical protein